MDHQSTTAWLQSKMKKAQQGLWAAKAARGPQAKGDRCLYHGQVILLTELLHELGAHRSSYILSPSTNEPKTRKQDLSPGSPQGSPAKGNSSEFQEAEKSGTRESTASPSQVRSASLSCGDALESPSIAKAASCTSLVKREARKGLGSEQGKASDLANGPLVLSK